MDGKLFRGVETSYNEKEDLGMDTFNFECYRMLTWVICVLYTIIKSISNHKSKSA